MRRPEFVARQGRCPSGLLGRTLAHVMAAETASENAMALELMELQPNDQVLEIGFGHGRTLGKAARIAQHGCVAGVEPSEAMLKVAGRRNRNFIAEGRVELKQGDTQKIPYEDRRFDKVYSVHTLYFWRDPVKDLQEIRRVMKEGGRFVLGFRLKDEKALAEFPASVYTFYTPDEVQSLLREAGFEKIRILSGWALGRGVLFAVAYRIASPI
ncbi:MAG: class I SAM-dependent methyltransferase [Acidobacteria bacterium]|nr:class I SAM-dependent methyltransferase [Acidobacteriota bacterium]